MKNTLIQIGQNIRTLRTQQNLSQERLAEIANLHRTFVGSIERGERNISIKTLVKIADALNTTIEKLITSNL